MYVYPYRQSWPSIYSMRPGHRLDLIFHYILKHQKSAPPDQPEPDNHLNTAADPSIGQMKEGTSRS